MNKRLKQMVSAFVGALIVLVAGGCAGTGGTAGGSLAEDKVVYHINGGLEQATNGLRNVRNHLEVNPKAKIVVVTHAQGVDFLMRDKKDVNGNPYEVTVQDLKGQGVQFDVCLITLRNRNLNKSQFIEESTFVPSGVAEITRLQQREGYAYLRP